MVEQKVTVSFDSAGTKSSLSSEALFALPHRSSVWSSMKAEGYVKSLNLFSHLLIQQTFMRTHVLGI